MLVGKRLLGLARANHVVENTWIVFLQPGCAAFELASLAGSHHHHPEPLRFQFFECFKRTFDRHGVVEAVGEVEFLDFAERFIRCAPAWILYDIDKNGMG